MSDLGTFLDKASPSMNDKITTTEKINLEPEDPLRHCCSRRDFVSAIVLSCPIVALLASCGQTPLSSGKGIPQSGNPAPGVTGVNGVFTFSFADFPVLQNLGGSLHTTIQAASGTKDVFITRVDTHTVDTVSTICTHAGCVLNAYDSTSQQYLCPCHGSVFSVDGAVVTGPAVTPLPTYASVVTSTGVEVTAT